MTCSLPTRWLPAALCLGSLVLAAWLGQAADDRPARLDWTVAPGVCGRSSSRLATRSWLKTCAHRCRTIPEICEPWASSRSTKYCSRTIIATLCGGSVLRARGIRFEAPSLGRWLEPEKAKFWRTTYRYAIRGPRLTLSSVRASGHRLHLEDAQSIEWRG